MELATSCYAVVRRMPLHEEFGLRSQIRRAAVSIPANVAEGYGRNSTRDYLRFLYVARGSLNELETHLLLAERFGYLHQAEIAGLMVRVEALGRILQGLCRALETRMARSSRANMP